MALFGALKVHFSIQVALVMCGLFIWKFVYSHLKIDHKLQFSSLKCTFFCEFRICDPKWLYESTANNEGNLYLVFYSTIVPFSVDLLVFEQIVFPWNQKFFFKSLRILKDLFFRFVARATHLVSHGEKKSWSKKMSNFLEQMEYS